MSQHVNLIVSELVWNLIVENVVRMGISLQHKGTKTEYTRYAL